MIAEKLRRYAELKLKEKEVISELETLKPEIKEYLLKANVDKLPTDRGTFTLSQKVTWKYSEAVEKLEEEEKAKGIAKQVITQTLLFKAPKPNEEQ